MIAQRSLRAVALFTACALGACTGDAYQREVPQPVSDVYRTLETSKFSIPEIPSAANSGGMIGAAPTDEWQPDVRLAGEPGKALTWQVVSNNEVAAAMKVTFEPTGDGKATKLRGNITRYTLSRPDARTEALLKGWWLENVFTMQLNTAVTPGPKLANGQTVSELHDEMQASMAAAD